MRNTVAIEKRLCIVIAHFIGKKRLVTTLILLLFTAIFFFISTPSANAQQRIEFSQYMLNLSSVNPAAVGNNGLINIFGTFRSQYAGFSNAPMTFDVSADIGFNIGKTKHGAGIRFYDNSAGIFAFQDIEIAYAYRIPLGEGTLSAGVDVAFTTLGVNKDKIHNVESDYHESSDPVIDSEANDFKVDLAVGVQYLSDKWFAGASLYNILSPEYRLSDQMYFEKTMNMRLMGGYNFRFNNPLYKLKTSAIINTDFVSWSGAVNANLVYKDSYWGGLGYRIDGAVVFMAGIKVLNGLVIGYSFDLPTSKLISSAGSHEVLLSYSFSVDFSKKNKYKSIRYL